MGLSARLSGVSSPPTFTIKTSNYLNATSKFGDALGGFQNGCVSLNAAATRPPSGRMRSMLRTAVPSVSRSRPLETMIQKTTGQKVN